MVALSMMDPQENHAKCSASLYSEIYHLGSALALNPCIREAPLGIAVFGTLVLSEAIESRDHRQG